MTRKIISITILGSLLTAFGLASANQSQTSMYLSDAEISGIIVGGPVTECADCACPQCYNTICWDGPTDPIGGPTCQDIDGWLLHEDCNCDGYGFDGDYCHILTLNDCYNNRTFWKNPDYNCTQYIQPVGFTLCDTGGHGGLRSSDVDEEYDECTETGSNPHN